MSETKPIYKIDNAGCPTCSAFGQVGSLGSTPVLFISGMAVTNLSGVCQTCGRPYHWNSQDRILSRIVRLSVEELNRDDNCH